MNQIFNTKRAIGTVPVIPEAWRTRPLRVDASQLLHTPAGQLLRRMYYGDFLEAVLAFRESSGCPNDGERHTLYLKLAPVDLVSFLDLVWERYAAYPGVSEFVRSVQERTLAMYPHLGVLFSPPRLNA